MVRMGWSFDNVAACGCGCPCDNDAGRGGLAITMRLGVVWSCENDAAGVVMVLR